MPGPYAQIFNRRSTNRRALPAGREITFGSTISTLSPTPMWFLIRYARLWAAAFGSRSSVGTPTQKSLPLNGRQQTQP